MAKKTYVVAEGMAFTAMGHIFKAGEEIPAGAFSDKVYMAKMISEGKIIEANKTEEAPAEEPVETPAEEAPAEKPVETPVEETSVEETAEAPVEETSVEETAEAPAEEAPAEEPATKRSTAKGGK